MRSYQEQLKKIEATLKDGNFVGADGTPLKGQDFVKALLERCWKWSELVLERYAISPYKP